MEKELTLDTVREFVMAGHGNLDKIQSMLKDDPRLLNVNYEEWNETALGAASHVGNRPIAEYLLEQGAPMNICTAAMMGDKATVASFLQDNPAQSTATGAHGLTVLFHTAISGDTEIADLLVQYGGGEGASHALHPAIGREHVGMVKWLLEHGAETTALNFQGKTPLKAALEKGNQEIIDLLKQHGAEE